MRLRTILPLIATDLAAARRRAHALELENRRLAGRIAELESVLHAPTVNPGSDRRTPLIAASLSRPNPFGAQRDRRARSCSPASAAVARRRVRRGRRCSGTGDSSTSGVAR